MPVKVSFADLTHMGQMVAANTFPLGITMVAANAQKELGDEIEFEIFKYPEEFNAYLDNNTPQIACFSAFSWNVRLGHEYARRLKEVSPGTIMVFGGPNFPAGHEEQKEFLEKYPAIDCYFEFEGELAFVEFFRTMQEMDFDWEKFKRERGAAPNIRYLVDGEMIAADLAPKISDINLMPSAHLTGLLDKFYDDVLIPLFLTTRGCPYRCTFCWEGGDYFTKTLRYDQERISQELNYIAERAKVSDVILVDANFGMFKEDLETAKEIRRLQKKYDWPKTFTTATAKNHKKRTMEIVEILGDTMPPTSAVQTTDEEILKIIKRKNVSMDQMEEMAVLTAEKGGQSEAEIILCLQGDAREKHFRSVFDMLDAGMSYIRLYQFIMLPGTEAASRKEREEYGFRTKFRVLPRCFGTYTFRGETFPAAEVEEIVVANKTLPFEAYQACRALHLTVEVFNNDSLFIDLIRFLNFNGVKRSKFIAAVHERIVEGGGELAKLYAQYNKEEDKNMWGDCKEVESFVVEPGVIQRYIDGEYGTNELYKYRAMAIFEHLDVLHETAYSVARELLEEDSGGNEMVESYLAELLEFSLLRKRDVLETSRLEKRTFHFDFAALVEANFLCDPLSLARPEGIELEMFHNDHQRDLISGYVTQYGSDIIGQGRILVRANMNRLYRSTRRLDDSGGVRAMPSGDETHPESRGPKFNVGN
ncbi:MAG: cobalamin-dependent protein [Alphaproteobacteria bacterium]|nr:cobalamin-dependent protein [Alphaproteobacteria bacterium]